MGTLSVSTFSILVLVFFFFGNLRNFYIQYRTPLGIITYIINRRSCVSYTSQLRDEHEEATHIGQSNFGSLTRSFFFSYKITRILENETRPWRCQNIPPAPPLISRFSAGQPKQGWSRIKLVRNGEFGRFSGNCWVGDDENDSRRSVKLNVPKVSKNMRMYVRNI